jgi:ribosomal protein S16
MKLAEALLLRADQKKKLASLRERITRNAIVQEGEQPSENVEELLKQATSVMQEHMVTAQSINSANQTQKTADGRLLAHVLAERDSLVHQHSLIAAAIQATHKDVSRYGQKEIKWLPQIDVAAMQKRSDDLSRKIREINAVIQAANWQLAV